MSKILDRNGKKIKAGQTILFSLEDSVEPTGFNRFARKIETCYWSPTEKKYIRLKDVTDKGINKGIEIINK